MSSSSTVGVISNPTLTSTPKRSNCIDETSLSTKSKYEIIKPNTKH